MGTIWDETCEAGEAALEKRRRELLRGTVTCDRCGERMLLAHAFTCKGYRKPNLPSEHTPEETT